MRTPPPKTDPRDLLARAAGSAARVAARLARDAADLDAPARRLTPAQLAEGRQLTGDARVAADAVVAALRRAASAAASPATDDHDPLADPVT